MCTTATLLAGFLEGKIIALANAVVVSVENGVKASSTDVDPCYLIAVDCTGPEGGVGSVYASLG